MIFSRDQNYEFLVVRLMLWFRALFKNMLVHSAGGVAFERASRRIAGVNANVKYYQTLWPLSLC